MIRFEKQIEEAMILSPLLSFEKDTHEIEHRKDPLTGKRSFVGLRLVDKYETLVGNTDDELIAEIVSQSSEGCFFCPQKVGSSTPKFIEGVLPEGRIRVGESTLFPNLFPLSTYHALIIPSESHFLKPEEFSAPLLTDAIKTAQVFINNLSDDRRLYGSINSNYMPPAGASAVHPHFQLIVSTVPSSFHEEMENALRAYSKKHSSDYWNDLISAEKDLRERYLGSTGSVEWLASFSPRGANEVIGICPKGKFRVFSNEVIESIADGISRVLSFYGSKRHSSFNLSFNLGDLNDDSHWNRPIVRLVTRQNFSRAYRAGEHFFQHLLETEVIVLPPEALSKELIQFF